MNISLKRKLSYFFFTYFAQYLPRNEARFFRISAHIRAFFVRRFIDSAAEDIYVQKLVTISPFIEIGNHSSIGIRSQISRNVSIGDNVMMGPECYVYTDSHEHKQIDIPMREQGYTESSYVNIGNDVWIGSRVTIIAGGANYWEWSYYWCFLSCDQKYP